MTLGPHHTDSRPPRAMGAGGEMKQTGAPSPPQKNQGPTILLVEVARGAWDADNLVKMAEINSIGRPRLPFLLAPPPLLLGAAAGLVAAVVPCGP